MNRPARHQRGWSPGHVPRDGAPFPVVPPMLRPAVIADVGRDVVDRGNHARLDVRVRQWSPLSAAAGRR